MGSECSASAERKYSRGFDCCRSFYFPLLVDLKVLPIPFAVNLSD
jgi:hypothetical protein